MKPRLLIAATLSLAGLGFAVWASRDTSEAPKVTASLPASPTTVLGVGIVEPSSEFIRVASPHAGLVHEVFVTAGDLVRRGDPLLRLDTRGVEDQIAVLRARVAAARAELDEARQAPREEYLLRAMASEDAARARTRRTAERLELLQKAHDGGASSRMELIDAEADAAEAEALLRRASAARRELESGTWPPTLDRLEASLATAEAELDAAEGQLARMLIESPIDATVLRVYVRLGEFHDPAASNQGAVRLGALTPLHVRVDLDEDLLLIADTEQSATLRLRGFPNTSVPLAFVRIEPDVIPKRSLSGSSTERVDTRVLQIIYRVVESEVELYPGQQVDIEIPRARSNG